MNVKEIKLGFIYENEIMVVWLLISKNVCDFFLKKYWFIQQHLAKLWENLINMDIFFQIE